MYSNEFNGPLLSNSLNLGRFFVNASPVTTLRVQS